MPAELEVTFAPISGRSGEGPNMPAFNGVASASETLSVADTASTVSAGPNNFARLVNSGDAALYVALGAAPDASAAPRWFLGVGQTLIVSCPESGKAAFVAK